MKNNSEELKYILSELDVFDKNSIDFLKIFYTYEKMKSKYLEIYWKKNISKKDLEDFKIFYENLLKKEDILPENKQKLLEIFKEHLEKLKALKKEKFYSNVSNFLKWVWSILDFWWNLKK